VRPAQREFWRVLNASADTFFDLALRNGPAPGSLRPLRLVAIDGVPLDPAAPAARTWILLPPGSRAEFIVETPPAGPRDPRTPPPPALPTHLTSRRYEPGPDGDPMSPRAIPEIVPAATATVPRIMPSPAPYSKFATPAAGPAPARSRLLYFSEERQNPARYF